MKEKIIIVGGVAGGASTATRLRRLSEDYEIIMFEKGKYPSFANCGLPYHIGEVISERESLIIQSPEKFHSRFRIDVRVESEVISISAEEKKLWVRDKDGKHYEESFDFLVLAPGAKPFLPPIPGIESSKVFSLRNIADMDKIIQILKSSKPKSVAILGAGFIGVEMAENLKHLGLETHIIEAAPHILAPFDSDFAVELENTLIEENVQVHLSTKVIEFKETADALELYLEGGEVLKTDFAITAIGVRPDTKFLENSGILLNEKGSILVNDYLETNFANIYALGDAIPGVPLAGPANRQGRIVANNIAGKKETYQKSMGTAIIKIFDMVAACTGKNERALTQEGLSYSSVLYYPKSHASYYPNATELRCKILFEKESGKILGAQAIGYEGVDKYIDTLATLMHFKGDIYDLSELELCYAPPFGSAKSNPNMAGFIGRNLQENLVQSISGEEVQKKFSSEKHILLDVRTEEEHALNPIPNSILIPLDSLRENLSSLEKEKEIWVFCAVGLRGYIASRILTQAGFTCKNISGGFRSLQKRAIEKDNIIPHKEENNIVSSKKIKQLNLCGLSCPGPLLSLKAEMEALGEGESLRVQASDSAFANDVQAWAKINHHSILSLEKKKGITEVVVEKASSKRKSLPGDISMQEDEKSMTIIFFSGDYDKAIASLILANGAVAMGKKVTIFFTFWGLSLLKKERAGKVQKSFLDKLFSLCLPSSWRTLPLSKMNFGGMGRKMMEYVMKKKDLISLEQLLKEAKKNNISLIACTMSMEAMGIHESELIDGIDFGGVAQYLGEADKANTNLFI